MDVVHRSGRKHVNADSLSRDSADMCSSGHVLGSLEMLPCGGCRYCRRAHERWSDFAGNVDDVIPLTRLFDEEISTRMDEDDALVAGIVRTVQLSD
jgi:hypothetical protein